MGQGVSKLLLVNIVMYRTFSCWVVVVVQVLLSCLMCSCSEFVDKNFMAACHYLKDRMAEVSTPNKEMVRKKDIYFMLVVSY